jgi:hypothetical protein
MVETSMLQAGGLMVLSLALFIGSWVSYGLFKDKNCVDGTGHIQNVNIFNVVLSVMLFVLSVAIYMKKVVLSDNNFIVIGFVVALVLFIDGLVQYNAIKNSLSCDDQTRTLITNWNMLVWIVALMTLILTAYMYYGRNKDDIYKSMNEMMDKKQSFRFFMK